MYITYKNLIINNLKYIPCWIYVINVKSKIIYKHIDRHLIIYYYIFYLILLIFNKNENKR